jgi:hypothetical protein
VAVGGATADGQPDAGSLKFSAVVKALKGLEQVRLVLIGDADADAVVGDGEDLSVGCSFHGNRDFGRVVAVEGEYVADQVREHADDLVAIHRG